MPTPNLVSDIINEAFADLGVVRVGEGVSTAVQTDAFMRLNQMWAAWSSEEAISNAIYHQVLNGVQAGVNIYTFGTGGTLAATAPPIKIIGAESVSGNFRSPVKVVSFAEFDLEASDELGSSSTLAKLMGVDNSYPTMNLRLFPMPANSPGSLILDYYGAMTPFASVSTSLSLHPAFEDALHFNLAVKLLPRYGRQNFDPTALLANAQTSKAIIADLNRSMRSTPQQAA